MANLRKGAVIAAFLFDAVPAVKESAFLRREATGTVSTFTSSLADVQAQLASGEMGRGGDRSARTFALEASMEAVAERVVRGEETVTPATAAAFDAVKDTMQLVIDDTVNQTAQDQAWLDGIKRGLVVCGDNVIADHTSPNGIDALANRSHLARTEHQDCRWEEGPLWVDWQAKKDDFEFYARALTPPACGGVGWPSVRPSPEVATCIVKLYNWSSVANVTYPHKEKLAAEAHDKWSAIRETCNGKQSFFESEFCQYHAALTETCREQDTCRSDLLATRNTSHAAVKVSEAGRKAENEAAQRVLCFVDLLTASAEVQAAKLQECKGKSYDTSALDMTYPEVPAAAVCDVTPVQVRPCDIPWQLHEYADQPWYPEARTRRCTPCVLPL